MRIKHALIRVVYPNGEPASAYSTDQINIPFDVDELHIKSCVYKSTKNVSNQNAEYLCIKSNLVQGGPLSFVYDDITKPSIFSGEITFKFERPQRFAGHYHFMLEKGDGSIYTTGATDYLMIIAEFVAYD